MQTFLSIIEEGTDYEESIPVRLLEDSNSTAPGRYDCSHNDFMCDHGDDRCALKREIKSSIF